VRLDLDRLPELNSEPLPWAAVFYARIGIPTFPLRPGTKEPYADTRGVLDATTDTRLVHEQWCAHPTANIGLACGAVFDALDADVKDDRPGMESLSKLRRAGLLRGVWGKARTPTGGLHLLFAPSGAGNSNHGAGSLGLDYRGRGGYIVAAPSTTPRGAYQWDTVDPDRRGLTFDWEAAKRALGLIKPPAKVEYDGDKSADGLIHTVAEAPVGTRNDLLYWAARRAIGDGLNPDILREPALAAGLSDSEIDDTLDSAAKGAAA
jgi:hypothetical protein